MLIQLRIHLATYLDIIALVVIAALTEESVMYYTVDVKLIEQWVAILSRVLV